jgi:trypsin
MRRGSPLIVIGALTALSLAVPASASAQSNGSVQPRIVGGSPASISQYPWQAALVFSPATESGNAHDRQYCGGSLITSRIVITAAHCVYDMSPAEVNVVLGRTKLSDSGQGLEVPIQALSYQSNYNHPPPFSSVAPRFDVGYLVLTQPSSQPRIQIAGGGEASLWSPAAVQRISGWGCTSEPVIIFDCTTSDDLRHASVPIVADSTCGSSDVYGSDIDPQTMVCAGNLGGGADSCHGDSGGPLQAPMAGGGYRLVGITSWGVGCGDPNAPGVYARVAGAAIRPLVGADVCALETANGLAHETVIAGPAAESACDASQPKKAKKAFAKCKRIRSKKKRKRCVKRVKRKQKQI